MVGSTVVPAATGMKPESPPPATGAHGAASVDCVTVWFFAVNVKITYVIL